MYIAIVNLRKIRKITAILLFATLLIGVAMHFFIPWLRDGYISASASANGSAKLPVIVIDAGHGGEDSGAIGVNGELEKDINLQISMMIGDALTQRGYTVYYTRTDDKMLYKPEENVKGLRKISDLKTRLEFSAQFDAPIFISIHQNSFGSAKYSGLQVFYGGTSGSDKLAGCIQSAVSSELQPENKRTIKAGQGMFLLEKNPNTSVIIECGFMSNPDECEKLSQKEYQKQLSLSITCGIIEYIESIKEVKG